MLSSLTDHLRTTTDSRLETAAAKKFGDAGKLPAEASVDVVADMEAATEKLEGDTAKMITKNKTEDMNPMTLKKDGSSWKVDLSTLSKDPEAAADLLESLAGVGPTGSHQPVRGERATSRS